MQLIDAAEVPLELPRRRHGVQLCRRPSRSRHITKGHDSVLATASEGHQISLGDAL
eukprot:COSAG01_NODE_22329_length_860_cov_1.011827_1_plen_55_part_01